MQRHARHAASQRRQRGASLRAVSLLLGAFACGSDYEGELAAFDGSNLPVLVIDSAGHHIADEPKIPAELRLFPAPSGLDALAGVPALESAIGIEVRGYTSQEFPKKQYSIEVRDGAGNDLAIEPLGLPAEADWVLHAPYMDKSLMRNALGYELSRSMGRYAPRTRFVELFLLDDGTTAPALRHYRGLYVLTERVERGADRVDIERLEPSSNDEPSLSGGYLLEWTQSKRVRDTEVTVSTRNAEALLVDYPKPEDVTSEQVAWIERYLGTFEAALAELDTNPESVAFESFLDVDAAVDFCLLSELVRNHDVFVASTFVHKPRGEPLVIGPVWDLDRAFGDVEFDGNWRSEGWLLPSRGWAQQLLQSSNFRRRYAERWHQLRADVWNDERIDELIAGYELELAGAAERNFEKWQILGHYIKANRAPYSRSFSEEVAKLGAWLHERTGWIDANIDQL